MDYYLTVDQVIMLHAKMIELYGGTYGVRDISLLDSALQRIKSGYYENKIDEAAALMESLANNHPFIDGNKRVAFAAVDIFLRGNNYSLNINSSIAYDEIMQMFDQNKFNFLNICIWLRSITSKN